MRRRGVLDRSNILFLVDWLVGLIECNGWTLSDGWVGRGAVEEGDDPQNDPRNDPQNVRQISH